MRLVRRPTERHLAERLPAFLAHTVTYDEIGCVQQGRVPAGSYHLEQATATGADFERLAEALLCWRLQRAAGLVVATSSTGRSRPPPVLAGRLDA